MTVNNAVGDRCPDQPAAPPQPGRWRFVTRGALWRLLAFAIVLCLLSAWAFFSMIRMPGESYRGPLPPLTGEEAALAEELQRHVVVLADNIGPRHVMRPDRLELAAAYIEHSLRSYGCESSRQTYVAEGVECSNIEAEKRGATRPEEIVIVGAHYDSVYENNCPGANDNASGVAATLALAQRLSRRQFDRTIRFVLFVNEEPPFFQTESMGSLVYARRCRQREENVVAMLSLETIGCYDDRAGSQEYPPPFSLLYPGEGNFIAFVGNHGSRTLVRDCVRSFRSAVKFPSEGGALPGWITGVGWSDHWSFWEVGYPAVMVTDTALFRYEHYHSSSDTPDKLDYERMARVVRGLEAVVQELARNPESSARQ